MISAEGSWLLDTVTDRLADAATVISVALHDGGVHLHRREQIELRCLPGSGLLSRHGCSTIM